MPPATKVCAVSFEDKLTNVAVRRLLTSHWVDITLVNVRTVGGVVYLRGYLKRMTASHQEFHESTLRELDSRLRRVPTVRDVKYQLDNWERKLTAQWVEIRNSPLTTGASDAPPPA